jgi:Arc/MetJ family transcription regulator
MSKTLIDVDDELLDQAQAALGARTKKETVNRALAVAVASVARQREVERLDDGVYADLGDPAVAGQAWR